MFHFHARSISICIAKTTPAICDVIFLIFSTVTNNQIANAVALSAELVCRRLHSKNEDEHAPTTRRPQRGQSTGIITDQLIVRPAVKRRARDTRHSLTLAANADKTPPTMRRAVCCVRTSFLRSNERDTTAQPWPLLVSNVRRPSSVHCMRIA